MNRRVQVTKYSSRILLLCSNRLSFGFITLTVALSQSYRSTWTRGEWAWCRQVHLRKVSLRFIWSIFSTHTVTSHNRTPTVGHPPMCPVIPWPWGGSGLANSECAGTPSDTKRLDWDPDRNTGLRSRQKDWISGLHLSGLNTANDVFVFTE